MTSLEYRSPTAEDIQDVASRMRAADVLEVYAASGLPPLEALAESVRSADEAFVAVFDGRPEAIFGFVAETTLSAAVWMVGTTDLPRHGRELVREGRRIVAAWNEHFPVLHNFVDDDNVVSKGWLRRLGFTVHDRATPRGALKAPFRYFYRVPHV